MAISLYDATVAAYLQIARAASGWLGKGLAHCRETGADPEELTGARLYPDMMPLAFQIELVNHHSLPAIEGCKTGVFKPPPLTFSTLNYAGLQKMIVDTIAGLEVIPAGEVNTLEERDVVFVAGDRKVSHTTLDFLLSFSVPNFYFHAITAYDILRSKGVKIGKRDFLGTPRMKG
ncbi:MAG: DUF1993 domain-containing protein [Rhizomicrobium sp.]